MGEQLSFDVLVIGSGASGLAAAVSAERAGARVALATKGALQSSNSAKAQGGIQAAFGEDDSPALHAEDVWRSSHETANQSLVEVLTGEAPSAIHWLEELGVEFTRENGGYRLARCGGASRKRLLQVADAASWGGVLRSTLPVPGEGTLEHRLSGISVQAKTGTLDDISALSGWVDLHQTGHAAQFSILSGGYDVGDAKDLEDAIVTTLAKFAH